MNEHWRRLDPLTIPAVGLLIAAGLIPTTLIMLITGAGANVLLGTVAIWLGIAALVCAFTALDWYFTGYRITGERFELRKGVVSRSHRSIPRERIRSVDLTTDLAHRLFGLSVVKIGTGRRSGQHDELALDSLPHRQAEFLRQELFLPAELSTPDIEEQGRDDETVLARIQPSWVRYWPLTLSLILLVWGAAGSALGSFSEVLSSLGLFGGSIDYLRSIPIWLSSALVALSLPIAGMLGSFLLSVEMWWGFRLTRESGATLRVRRGLLTARSVTLEQRRLRGIEIAEPLLLRWAGGARVNAVATGLSQSREGNQPESTALLPPAPRADALRVAATVLHEPQLPVGDRLSPHPRAALRRRLIRTLAAAAPIIAAAAVTAAVGWLPLWAACCVGVAAVASAIAFGVDAYRGLGHHLSEKFLVTRRGTGVRRTVALERSGIIGWRVKRSLFQRRSGLLTIAATTAAGENAYEIRDVATTSGLAFADEAVPDLLQPFLERH